MGPIGSPVQLWTFKTGGAATRSPAVVDGVVFQGSADQFVYALSAASGEEIWKFQGDSSMEMTPTVLRRESSTSPA